MIILFLLASAQSLPLFGNFSQFYYYTQLQGSDGIEKQWIIDSNLYGAIQDCKDNYTLGFDRRQEFYQVNVQAFIVILTKYTENHITLENDSYQLQCGYYYTQLQEVNNYLGLKEYIQLQNVGSKELRLCLAQNGGYFSLGKFQYQNNGLKLNYGINKTEIKITKMFADSKEIRYQDEYRMVFDARVDFNYPHMELPRLVYSLFKEAFICTGFFCPPRKDQNGMICYEKGDLNIQSFYKHFKTFEFEISEVSIFWYPADYFVTTDDNIYCFPIKSGREMAIFGQPWLRNKEAVFGFSGLTLYYNQCENDTLEFETQRLSIPFNTRTEGFSCREIEYVLIAVTFIVGLGLMKWRNAGNQQSPINPFTNYQ